MSRGLISVFCLFSLLSIGLVYSIETLPFQCEFVDSSNDLGAYQRLFFASNNLSGNVEVNASAIGYKYPFDIRCNAGSVESDVKFSIKEKTSVNVNVCGDSEDGYEEVMYFTQTSDPSDRHVNSRVSRTFDKDYHDRTLCADFEKPDGVMNIIWNNRDFTPNGYTCLFKTNDVENGLVSSCDAQFDGTKKYEYTVWGILLDSIDTLNCMSDCTSKLDGRVYSICRAKIRACGDVPFQCDGSLSGAWVKYNDTEEVQCVAPWNNYRSRVFSGDTLSVETKENACDDLIKIEYPVLLNNEQVVMNIYMCGD